MNLQTKAMTLNPQQLLRVLKMPGFSFFISNSLSLRFGSRNIGMLNGKGMELCEEIKKEGLTFAVFKK